MARSALRAAALAALASCAAATIADFDMAANSFAELQSATVALPASSCPEPSTKPLSCYTGMQFVGLTPGLTVCQCNNVRAAALLAAVACALAARALTVPRAPRPRRVRAAQGNFFTSSGHCSLDQCDYSLMEGFGNAPSPAGSPGAAGGRGRTSVVSGMCGPPIRR